MSTTTRGCHNFFNHKVPLTPVPIGLQNSTNLSVLFGADALVAWKT